MPDPIQERTCVGTVRLRRPDGEGGHVRLCGAPIVETADYGNPILVCTSGHPQPSGHPIHPIGQGAG